MSESEPAWGPIRDEFAYRLTVAGAKPAVGPLLERVEPDERDSLLHALVVVAIDRLGDEAADDLLEANPDLAADLWPLLHEGDSDNDATVPHAGLAGVQPPVERLAEPALHVRCPHCGAPIELVADASLDSVHCDSCDSEFGLVDTQEDADTRHSDGVTHVAHFRLVERVGMGAFGAVWKAHDEKLDRTVAIKIPRRGQLDSHQQKIFLREAQNAAQLSHPGVVPVHEVGREGDTLYVVSEFVRGVTLGDWLSGQQPTTREAVTLCRQIAEALQHAHDRGVIHRDLKPHNVMLQPEEDGSFTPRLMDFGLARREAGEITMTTDGQVLGTPAYMAPEQARGESHTADARADVYALGVILFELLTGELPFRGNPRMLLHQVIHDEPPSPRKLSAAVPRDLETITLKCLEKEPGRRYASASAVTNELGRWLEGRSIAARPTPIVVKAARWCRRNPWPAFSIALAMALLSAVAVATSLLANSSSHALAIERKGRLEAEAFSAFLKSTLAKLATSQSTSSTTVTELIKAIPESLADTDTAVAEAWFLLGLSAPTTAHYMTGEYGRIAYLGRARGGQVLSVRDAADNAHAAAKAIPNCDPKLTCKIALLRDLVPIINRLQSTEYDRRLRLYASKAGQRATEWAAVIQSYISWISSGTITRAERQLVTRHVVRFARDDHAPVAAWEEIREHGLSLFESSSESREQIDTGYARALTDAGRPNESLPIIVEVAEKLSDSDARARRRDLWHLYYDALIESRGLENALADRYWIEIDGDDPATRSSVLKMLYKIAANRRQWQHLPTILREDLSLGLHDRSQRTPSLYFGLFLSYRASSQPRGVDDCLEHLISMPPVSALDRIQRFRGRWSWDGVEVPGNVVAQVLGETVPFVTKESSYSVLTKAGQRLVYAVSLVDSAKYDEALVELETVAELLDPITEEDLVSMLIDGGLFTQRFAVMNRRNRLDAKQRRDLLLDVRDMMKAAALTVECHALEGLDRTGDAIASITSASDLMQGRGYATPTLDLIAARLRLKRGETKAAVTAVESVLGGTWRHQSLGRTRQSSWLLDSPYWMVASANDDQRAPKDADVPFGPAACDALEQYVGVARSYPTCVELGEELKALADLVRAGFKPAAARYSSAAKADRSAETAALNAQLAAVATTINSLLMELKQGN